MNEKRQNQMFIIQGNKLIHKETNSIARKEGSAPPNLKANPEKVMFHVVVKIHNLVNINHRFNG